MRSGILGGLQKGVVNAVVTRPTRCFTTGSTLSSGHNRWSKIKHDKGKEDAKKSKVRTLLSQRIEYASKTGGPDVASNSKLAIAIENAKRGHLSKSSIDNAIAKGQGKSLSGVPLETITVEAMLPYGIAAIIEYQTESKIRILQDARTIINRRGGNVTPTSFLFEKKGKIYFEEHSSLGVDEVLEEAVEAGATDIMAEEGKIVVETAPEDVKAVAGRLVARFKLEVESAEIVFDPKADSMVELNGEQVEEVRVILDLIEEEPSLQNLYINSTSV